MAAMNAMRSRAGKYLGDAARGVQRAPVEVIATLCVAITFSWAVELGDEAFQSWAEVAVSCVLLLAVAWTGTLLHAMGTWSAGRRWAFTLGGVLLVLLYGLTTADFAYAGEGWRAVLLGGAAVMWLVALPAFAGPRDSRVDRMRRIDGRILLRLIGAVLYGAALFAGLALALRAIDVLFELKIDEEIYLHVWAWIAFVLIPWIVLGGLVDYVRPIEQSNEVAGVAHRIALYLVPPLLVLYFLILYAYVIRIFVTGEIPKNLVSPMVLAAGGLSTLGLLLFDPRPAAQGVFKWLRLAAPLFLPLAPLGAWALVVRIEQYGWTEFRVMRLALLAALALLAVGATVQIVRRRAFALHLVPLLLAAVLLLGAVGPWSALSLSRRSQEGRLYAALTRVGVAPGDTARAPRPPTVPADTEARVVPAADYEQIRSSAQYLANHFGPQSLPPVLQHRAPTDEARWRDFAAELGLRPDVPVDGASRALAGSLPLNVPLELESGTAYRVSWSQHRRTENRTEATTLNSRYAVLLDSTRLAFHIGDRVFYADMRELIGSLSARTPEQPGRGDLPPDKLMLPVTDPAGVNRGELLVWRVFMDTDSTGLRIGNMDGLLIVRRE